MAAAFKVRGRNREIMPQDKFITGILSYMRDI